MTVGDATAARWSGHCRNQNNLDYIFQYCNGWMQNKNAYSMGKYCKLFGWVYAYTDCSQSQRLLNIPSERMIMIALSTLQPRRTSIARRVYTICDPLDAEIYNNIETIAYRVMSQLKVSPTRLCLSIGPQTIPP